ncbi:MAG: hypothetical protein JOZ01_03870, partial [Candidatus Eremiobacteraeota bacterium]|nr:hypothetical protein [Candidatus Eremiobacteraeota bacterium]
MRRARLALVVIALIVIPSALTAAAARAPIVLPNGWIVNAPTGSVVQTGTMPQGMALSPDATTIAVVESGYSPPALSLYRVSDLSRVGSIPLPGAFGKPVWRDAGHVLVAGANADALLDVDVRTHAIARIALPKGSYPAYVAASPDGSSFAVADDGDGAVRIGALATLGHSPAIVAGTHPGGIAYGEDGKAVFVTSRPANTLIRIDVAGGAVTRQSTGLHPGALTARNGKIYIAQSDADSVGIYDAQSLHHLHDIAVGDAVEGARAIGVSPNAITPGGDTLFVSLGAANSIAVIRDDRLAGRVAAGWYPTDVLSTGNALYVLDGKGEGARANPNYRMNDDRDYIGTIEYGSLRAYPLPGGDDVAQGNPQGARGWDDPPASAVVRKNGPIAHVFLVLKENRTYDQVLGDVRAGNGDASLAWFGRAVTPNQHALAARFGLFDNAYTSGEVSDAGHMWTDAAFANDYVERFWPPIYGGRRELDDLSSGSGARVPAEGYLWDAARRAGVSFRDYGELVDADKAHPGRWSADVPSLIRHIDPWYPGWDLNISDVQRLKEWRRDFKAQVSAGTLPQLELIWLPNDHTYGSKPGALAPASYVAINDYALGQMIDTLSHSNVWKSSAMFVIEDD